MPPVVPPRWVCCTLVCFLTRFTPSTITRSDSGSTEMTLPSRPLALPEITRTRSPFLMCISEHLRSERDDLHDALLAQLTVGLQDHRGVLVEPDVGAVRTPALLDGADDDGLHHVALLHTATGDRVLDGGDDRVADTCVAATGATENADAENLLRTRVVGDLQPRLLLDHLAFSKISTTRQRLVADSGRVSIRSTRSPTPQAFCSSWALSLLLRRMTLPYSGCLTRSSTSTVTVLSILSLTTRPSRVLRRPRGSLVTVLSFVVFSVMPCSRPRPLRGSRQPACRQRRPRR